MGRFDTLMSPGRGASEPLGTRTAECLTSDDVLAFAQGHLPPDRLSAVYAHVDTCSECEALLEEAVHAVAAEPVSQVEMAAWSTTFQPGALIAQRYRIDRFVARGGMGEVYEAFDRDLGERIALKAVVSTACDNPRAVQYLKREVQLSRRVSHPNVCRIFDLSTHTSEATGAVIPFLTMEFVDGEPLGRRLRDHGPLEYGEAMRLARGLLEGLRAAHGAGILHRDFKSDNVMLRTTADGLVPVILDFGLARCLEGDSTCLPSVGSQGLVGTLNYMAPEQVEGRPLSPASDLYSLGVVWFEMLTGQLPFRSESATANALERLRRPPSSPSSVNPKVPKAVDAIVLRLLGRKLGDRYRSADEALAALDALPAAQQSSTKRRAWKVASLLLSLAALGGWALVKLVAAPTVKVPATSASAAVTASVATMPVLGALPSPVVLAAEGIESLGRGLAQAEGGAEPRASVERARIERAVLAGPLAPAASARVRPSTPRAHPGASRAPERPAPTRESPASAIVDVPERARVDAGVRPTASSSSAAADPEGRLPHWEPFPDP